MTQSQYYTKAQTGPLVRERFERSQMIRRERKRRAEGTQYVPQYFSCTTANRKKKKKTPFFILQKIDRWRRKR